MKSRSRSPRSEVRTMSWKKLSPAVIAIMLALPAVLVVGPATAQATVPFAPSIQWQNQVGFEQRLYLDFERSNNENNHNGNPDCNDPTSTGVNKLDLDPQSNLAGGTAQRPRCYFPVGAVAGGEATKVVFETRSALTRAFNVSGNTSLHFEFRGELPTNTRLNVEVQSSGGGVRTAFWDNVNNSEANAFGVDIPLDERNRYTFNKNDVVRLTLSATPLGGGGLPVGGAALPDAWSVTDTGSYLQIRSFDAIRAATWVRDESGVIRNVFSPLPRDIEITGALPRIVGVFAVDSALGDYEAAAGGAPTFIVDRDGVSQPGAEAITGVLNQSLSVEEGRAVWEFPMEYLDYRGWAAGEYNLTVQKRHPQGNSYVTGVRAPFLIGAQSVRLSAYAGDQLAHEVAPGGATTYVLALNNTGSVNDTYAITAEFVSGTPEVGWGIRLGGPGLATGSVRVAPNEQKLITATVTAPFASVGESSVFLITARSLVDSRAENASVALASRISNEVRREVGVIAPTTTIAFEPGDELRLPVYAWNKGTRVANLSFAIDEVAEADWTVDFLQGTQRVDRTTISGAGAGDIVASTLVVRGPINRPQDDHVIKLNVTLLDAVGHSAEQSVTFIVVPTSSVRVDVLESAGSIGHLVEMQWADENDFEARDGVNGTWFRTWITNTGRVDDVFNLKLDRIRAGSCDDIGAFPDGENNFAFYFREPSGGRNGPISTVRVDAGKTAEVYVWVEVNPDAEPSLAQEILRRDCPSNIFVQNFAITATGQQTAATAIGSARVVAQDTETRLKTVKVEAVARDEQYRTNHYVDATQATRSVASGLIEVGKNTTLYARLTNGASHRTYTDARGVVHAADALVQVGGYDFDSGWNVSIRPRNGEERTDLNPWAKTAYLSVSNDIDNKFEAWRDLELEIRVSPPANQQLLADQTFRFFLQGKINGSSDTHTLPFDLQVVRRANVSLWPDSDRVLAHPGEPASYLLLVANNGSSETEVSLRARMNPDATPDRGQGWSLVLGADKITLPAKTNRTIALLVTPPATATQGLVGEVNITYEFADVKFPNAKANDSKRLFAEIVPADSISLTSTGTTVTAAPGGFANFTLSLSSTRSAHYRLTSTPIPNWTAFLSPNEGNLSAGTPQTVTLVMRVPTDVVDGSSYASVIRAVEVQNGNNFDSIPVNVNIQGGRAIASLGLTSFEPTVDRGQARTFPVELRNIGNAGGLIRLEARTQDPSWTATFTNVNDSRDPYVYLAPNELRVLNVSVAAPLVVPENTLMPIDVFAYSPGFTQSAHAVIQARIHDYGLTVSVSPPSLDLVPGTATEVVLKLRNRGNDNDTLNVSYMGNDQLPEWIIDIPVDRIQLEPGAERELKARIQSPTGQLPTARTYNFKFYAGTLGGAAVSLAKNDTSVAAVTVYRYQAVDVDRDDQPELAIDMDKRNGNGYEVFREIFGEGVQTEVVKATLLDGRTRFLLDVPVDRHDGVADVWFDPENVFALTLAPERAHDVTGDRAPDYLLDTDRDNKVDKTYDTETDRYLTTVEVKVYGDDRIQYLVDTRGDGRFTRFYDPETKVVTDTQTVKGQPATIIGIDTDDDKKVDKYYDTQSGRVSDARVANFADFAASYWYFFIVFAAMLVVTIALIVRRRKHA